MWKKALWVYLGLYSLGVLYLIINVVIDNINAGDFQLASNLVSLLLFAPAGAVAWGLRGKRVPILLTLLGLFVIAIPVAGIFNFNSMSLATIGKALLFVPMLGGLFYFGYKRLFVK